jgi:hypothetical protein
MVKLKLVTTGGRTSWTTAEKASLKRTEALWCHFGNELVSYERDGHVLLFSIQDENLDMIICVTKDATGLVSVFRKGSAIPEWQGYDLARRADDQRAHLREAIST